MENKLKVGIIGVGTVGGALKHFFEKKGRAPLFYDGPKELGSKKKVNGADIVFITVPTPFKEEKGFDLSLVDEAISYLEPGKIVIIKSTVLPGSTDKLQEKYIEHKLLFSPEFLREASAKKDILAPERQIVGFTEKSKDVAERVLEILPPAPFKKIMRAKEAEMVKYFGNTFLALKVIFANQIYDLCQKMDIDYEVVKEAAVADGRIGDTHLNVFHAGYRGYGGKCFPKDIRALIQLGDRVGAELELHKLAEKINNNLMKKQGLKDPEDLSAEDKKEK